MTKINQSAASEEMQYMVIFVLANNLVFEIIYYKGTPKSPFLFEIFLCLHQVQTKGFLILHVMHIAGTMMIKDGIDVLSIGNNLLGMTRRVNLLKIVPVDVGAVEILPGLEAWLRSWWGANLKNIQTSGWFEVQGDNFLWAPAPATTETVIELLLESHLQHIYRSHLIVVPRLMSFLWRKQIGKEAGLLFTLLVGIPFGYLVEHEPLTIALFRTVITCRNWRVTWKIKVSYWASRTDRDIHTEFKIDWYKMGISHLGGEGGLLGVIRR